MSHRAAGVSFAGLPAGVVGQTVVAVLRETKKERVFEGARTLHFSFVRVYRTSQDLTRLLSAVYPGFHCDFVFKRLQPESARPIETGSICRSMSVALWSFLLLIAPDKRKEG